LYTFGGQEKFVSDIPYTLTAGGNDASRSFRYLSYQYWAGNDSIQFQVFQNGLATWLSPTSTDQILVHEVFYYPILTCPLTQLSVSSTFDHGHFAIDITQHAEEYFPGNKLYWFVLQLDNAQWASTTPDDINNDINLQLDNSQWGTTYSSNGVAMYIMQVRATLTQLRRLVSGINMETPFLQTTTTTSGNHVRAMATICELADANTDIGDCNNRLSNTANWTAAVTAGLPTYMCLFTMNYNGGTGNEASSSLPVPALVFAWIGIGLVAAGCYGCLFWRWWKNRRLQQKTRTNMAAGANASRYLHSL